MGNKLSVEKKQTVDHNYISMSNPRRAGGTIAVNKGEKPP